ncbi:NADH-ubiquinone oxidoreductase 299 kDa subunit [Lophium mytilinum]|uniref:NADH-ubiquinone oxidoreductase 299 kDa subunit n=1 Tax=Lophium mytilinum TaxID=390894 RepID=A0A6A6QAA1_9PEZI|nr:NADH-ubiquinone oxidoreductase 299 kDa subunit [Lophium mytilinum]
MRAAFRLLANVKSARFLEPGAPTGLTGLSTHPSPRSTLIYLYSSTLDKLQQIPESSIYRQSTEALTKHRLAIVEAQKPAGFDAWLEKVRSQVEESPHSFEGVKFGSKGIPYAATLPIKGEERDENEVEWDGEDQEPPIREGAGEVNERRNQAARFAGKRPLTPETVVKIVTDPEPQLTADEISDIESQIGAGLIEEVIQVAHGENALVEKIIESKAWESLVEPSPEGQWSYFERGGTHTSTQKP